MSSAIDVHILNNDPEMTISETDIEGLRTMVRFPKNTTISLKQGDLLENVNKERNTDVNIFNIEKGMTIDEMIKIVNQSRISAIFCADSDSENVLV